MPRCREDEKAVNGLQALDGDEGEASMADGTTLEYRDGNEGREQR